MDNSLNIIFDDNKKTVLLHIKKEDLDLDIVRNFALAENLFPKQEFHITIIGRETGEILLKENLDFEKIKDLVKGINWNFDLTQEYYYITKQYSENEKRESIIQVVELPELSDFYVKLNGLTGQDFSFPFSHITLYTNSTKEENRLRGIGIYSKAEMEQLSPRVLQIDK